MANIDWTPLNRIYDDEKGKTRMLLDSASLHPLLPTQPKPVVTEVPTTIRASVSPAPQTASSSSPAAVTTGNKRVSMVKRVSVSIGAVSSLGGSFDPLAGDGSGSAGASAEMDPLSAPGQPLAAADPLSNQMSSISISTSSTSSSTSSSSSTAKKSSSDNVASSADPWVAFKRNIVQNYTVSGSIAIGASSFNEFSGTGVEEGRSFKAVDKYSQRLANLERQHQAASDKVTMTQAEYDEHVMKLSTALDVAWSKDERVASLKLAIQIARLLSDTSVPKFYPIMFTRVSDALEKFGRLVFERLRKRSEDCLNDEKGGGARVTFPSTFTSRDVPNAAKETCRNWFYKIACIRELLPRALIEITLLKSYMFLCEVDEFPQIISRLSALLRGLGDPLVSLYARTYLSMVAQEVAPQCISPLVTMVMDSLYSCQMLKSDLHLKSLNLTWGMTNGEYCYLMIPGLSWLLKKVGTGANKELFQNALQHFRDFSGDAMVLKQIIDSFDGSLYSSVVLGMITLIKGATPSCVNVVDLFAALGKQLIVNPPPEDQKISVLNEVWKVVSKSEDLSSYVTCCSAWLEVAHKHYSDREVMILLGDLTSKIDGKGADLSDTVIRNFESVIIALISQNSTTSTAVLSSDHLLKILDLFRGQQKLEVCKEVLLKFRSSAKTNDPSMINTVFEVGRHLHDSVDSLTPIGEQRHVASLIGYFVEKIDFGRDLEQQLNTYVECRAIFCNLDDVKDKLIICVSNLAVKAYTLMKGKHSKKTSSFVKACLAYCHITIPSITDTKRKLELMLLCAQIALLNQCLPQTDTFLKSAISLIPEVPAMEEIDGKLVHTEEKLSLYLRSLLSTLVVVPGHPEHGPFYIVQGLLNALPRYTWQPHTGVQTKVYCDMLALLASLAQRKFIYHVMMVESNDFLYASSPEYVSELKATLSTVIQEIVKQLTALGERTDITSKLNQSRMIFELVNQISARMELNKEVSGFVVKLLDLAVKAKSNFTRGDQKYLANTIDFILKTLAENPSDNAATFSEMLAAMRGNM